MDLDHKNPARKIEAAPSISKSDDGGLTIRCSGKLSCDCGTRLKALDIAVDEVFDGEADEPIGIKDVKPVCSHCHSDLLEVAL